MKTRNLTAIRVVGALAPLLLAMPSHAQNIEDEPLEDEPVPAAPQPQAPPQPEQQPENPAPAVPANPIPANPSPAAMPNGETVVVPRAVWEQLMRDVEELKRSRGTSIGSTIGGAPSTDRVVPPAGAEDPATGTGTSGGTGNRNFLLLPDISLITTAKGNFSSDKRDPDRRRFSLAESELNIQGYVYPNVKAVANIVAAPGEGEPFGMEEGYLNFQGARKNLSVILGRKFAPFGRTGEQHPHSWLYSRQLVPRANLVAGEALVGDGILARYLLPTGGKLYANLDLGVWNSPEDPGVFDSTTPFGTAGIEGGTASGFNDRFYTARLLLGKSFGADTEFELGASYARGRSQIDDEGAGVSFNGRNNLSGVDISLRRYMANNRRLLLRAEYFRNRPQGGLTSVAGSASGYYTLANMCLNGRDDIGLLYESSGFPQSPGEREKALSLIYTRQLTEQFYFRLHGTRGSRPGGDYSQIIGQVTFGIGPHTHELE